MSKIQMPKFLVLLVPGLLLMKLGACGAQEIVATAAKSKTVAGETARPANPDISSDSNRFTPYRAVDPKTSNPNAILSVGKEMTDRADCVASSCKKKHYSCGSTSECCPGLCCREAAIGAWRCLSCK